MDDGGWHRAGGFLALQLVGDAVVPGGGERAGATLLVLINGGEASVSFPLDTADDRPGGLGRGHRQPTPRTATGPPVPNARPAPSVAAPRSVLVARCYTRAGDD